MSADKHKMHNEALKLMLDKRSSTGMCINRKYAWGTFHKPSDNPVFQYMIDHGYATREREYRFQSTGYTKLVPTDKWLKIVSDMEAKAEHQRLADTGKLS